MPANAPNLLLILTDQHRLSAMGAYGPTVCRTPHLDRLAAESVRFERAYTACPVCSPARASVLTGLFPHAHGMTSNAHNLGCTAHSLDADLSQLFSIQLKRAGYQLGYTGKWHLGDGHERAFAARTSAFLPRHAGFEGQNLGGHGDGGHAYPEFADYLRRRGLSYTLRAWDEPTVRIRRAGIIDGPVEATEAHWLVDHTLSLVDRFAAQGDQPWMVWHNFWGPHEPYLVPESYLEPYRDIPIPPWPNFDWPARSIPGPHQVKLEPRAELLDWSQWETMVRYYYAFMTMIDEQVGRLMDHLRDTGQLENTVVIFAADHGETLGSHGGLTDKGWCHFEEIQRIPMLIRAPGAGPRVVEDLVSLVDLFPTLLDFAGLDPAARRTHGLSLRSTVEAGTPLARDQVAVEFAGVNQTAYTMRTIRWGNYKYGFNITGPDELYDLEADPLETQNRIDSPAYAEVADDGRRRMIRWMTETRDPVLRQYRFVRGHQLPADHPDLQPAPTP